MAQMTRLARYGVRFVTDPGYRNRVWGVINRQIQGAEHRDLVPSGATLSEADFLEGRRLFVAAGCDQTFLAEYLAALGMKVFHTDANGRASDPSTELLTPGSRALDEPWDYYLLSVSQVLRSLFRRLQVDGIDYTRAEQEADLAEVLENYRRAIALIREASPAPIFLYTYLVAHSPTYGYHDYRSMTRGWSLVEFRHAYHLRLYELARETAGVYVLDADLAVEPSGKSRAIDPAQSNGIFDHASREGARALGDHMVRHLAILEPGRRRVKCAVFDLDGTLWTGILREDGASGVTVHEYDLNVMEKLAARGILLALCSKNDPGELDALPGLLGEELHAKVVSRQLGWKPKSEMLRDIAEDLNIGLDSLAFFDDSPFERAEVAAHAPEVLVYGPEDIYGCLDRPEFHPLGELTRESLSRTAKYQQQARRKDAERGSGRGLRDFLVDCQLRLEIRRPQAGEVSRVFELLQRTNQLNATLTRTSREQLTEQFARPDDYLMATAKLADRFGDYGLIGFASARKGGDDWQLLELAFSCRSAGRGVEQAILAHIAGEARAAGGRSLSLMFTPGPRNRQMFELLEAAGFACPAGDPPGEGHPARMALGLGDPGRLGIPDWLDVSAPG